MNGVSGRVESVDRNQVGDGAAGSPAPPVLSHLPQDDSEPPLPTQNGNERPVAPPLKVSVLMCAFNEEERIEKAITEVLRTSYPCEIELIVVDDGSTDGTALIAERIDDPRIVVHRLANNMGKGYALRCAAALATGTHMLPFDADLEYSSDDIPNLIAPVIKRNYDVVYGARIFGLNTVYQSYRYAVGNLHEAYLAHCLQAAGFE
jgi:glycosyltransferase involved in cell wall biosynthesis